MGVGRSLAVVVMVVVFMPVVVAMMVIVVVPVFMVVVMAVRVAVSFDLGFPFTASAYRTHGRTSYQTSSQSIKYVEYQNVA